MSEIYEQYRRDSERINECIERRMEAYGESFDEAQRKCEELEYAEEEEEEATAQATDAYVIEPKVAEETFCGFCEHMHPTKILLSNGKVKEYSIRSYHVKPEMKLDSLGLTREATDLERCISAKMDVLGYSEEAAREECERQLNDPYFKQAFMENPMKLQPREQTDEQKFIANFVDTSKRDVHPEMIAAIYRQQQREKLGPKIQQREVHGLHDLYGKTKDQVFAETVSESKYAGRLTVGDVFTQKARKKAEDLAYKQTYQFKKYKPLFDKCVRERMAEGMTRGQAEAHCQAATLPSDQPTPASKVKK